MNVYAIITIYSIKEENTAFFTHLELLHKTQNAVMHCDCCGFMLQHVLPLR